MQTQLILRMALRQHFLLIRALEMGVLILGVERIVAESGRRAHTIVMCIACLILPPQQI